MATGILYGWPGLVLILKADGMYAPLCEGSEGFNHTESERGCPAQTAALTDLFNVAQATLTGAMVVNGNLLDRFGPRCVSCLGSSLCALGALLFALLPPPQPDDAFDMAYVSLCIMAVGGSGVHLSWFHLSNLFPKNRQTVSSIIIAGFVGSGAVFPLYQLLTDALPGDGFGRKQIFLLHGLLVACTVPPAIRLWPDAPFALGDCVTFTGWTLAYDIQPAAPAAPAAVQPSEKVQQPAQLKELEEAGEDAAAPATKSAAAVSSPAASSVAAAVAVVPESEMSFGQQLRCPSFWCMQSFFCIHFFRYVWLLGTLLEQFEAKEDTVGAGRTYTKITGWALPAAALLQPLVGLLLDRYGFGRGFLFVVFCGTVSSSQPLSLGRSSQHSTTHHTHRGRLIAYVLVCVCVCLQGYGALILGASLELQILMVRRTHA